MDIKFYYIDSDYVAYLKKYEIDHRGFTCVPNVEYSNRSKFVYGAVLLIEHNTSGVINYFVPVSSKKKTDQYSMLIATKDTKVPIKGSLRFRYMIPVPNSCLTALDIKTMIEPARQRLVQNELAACCKNRDKIFELAKKTYHDITTYRSEALLKNACDFILLEEAYEKYLQKHILTLQRRLV